MEIGNSLVTQKIQCRGSEPMLFTPQASLMYMILGITSIVMAILDIMLNSLVLYAVVVTKRFKTPVDVLLLLLISTDLTVGTFTLPMYANGMLQMAQGWLDCYMVRWVKTISFSLVLMSLVTIGLVSTQVYLSISRPFFYVSKLNKRVNQLTLVTSWVVIVLGTTGVFNVAPQYSGHFMIAFGTVSCLICIGVCVIQVNNVNCEKYVPFWPARSR